MKNIAMTDTFTKLVAAAELQTPMAWLAEPGPPVGPALAGAMYSRFFRCPCVHVQRNRWYTSPIVEFHRARSDVLWCDEQWWLEDSCISEDEFSGRASPWTALPPLRRPPFLLR
jgi:hypothetical protein